MSEDQQVLKCKRRSCDGTCGAPENRLQDIVRCQSCGTTHKIVGRDHRGLFIHMIWVI